MKPVAVFFDLGKAPGPASLQDGRPASALDVATAPKSDPREVFGLSAPAAHRGGFAAHRGGFAAAVAQAGCAVVASRIAKGGTENDISTEAWNQDRQACNEARAVR
jgi:hypothetical protein